MNNDLLNEVIDYIDWDPAMKTPEPYTIDRTKINHIFKRYFQGTTTGDALEKVEGTLYKTIAAHPLCNLLLCMSGDITEEKLVELANKPKTAIDRYEYAITDSKEFVGKLRNIMQTVWDTRQSGVKDFDLTKTSLDLPSFGECKAINKMLATTSLPPIQNILGLAKDAGDTIAKAQKEAKAAKARVEELGSDVETLQKALRTAHAEALTVAPVVIEEVSGEIPRGEVVHKKASELFGMDFDTDFPLPVFEWEGKHPYVPAIDEHYIFREKELTRVLYSIVTNQRAYLQGDTGTGKTTLIEQVAARLNFPFIRVNFDSEVTRMDLIGRDTLSTDESGNTISTFIDGILPSAMSSPCLFCCDEIDFVRPDVAYVMQSALEGNGLRITEDGDRVVRPHEMFRMFATGNTVGQGDEHGRYQGARPQSLALLDRFTIWINVGYLEAKHRKELVKRHFPDLVAEDQKKLASYVEEHLQAFLQSKIHQPISPRGMLAIAKATTIMGNFKEALGMTVLDRANADDRAVLLGLIDRVA